MLNVPAYPVAFKVKSAITGGDLLVSPNGDLVIDESRLSEEMARQPALYVYYATLAEEEYRRAKRIKFRLHCLHEDLDKKYRSEKRTTEKDLSNRIKRNPKMRALYERYVATMHRAGQLKVLKDAFEQRKDMLQSIGANKRKEEETEIRTLQRKMKEKLANNHRK